MGDTIGLGVVSWTSMAFLEHRNVKDLSDAIHNIMC